MIMWYNVTIISNMRVEQMKIKTVEMRYEDVLTLPAAGANVFRASQA